jgi:hypothetical protein
VGKAKRVLKIEMNVLCEVLAEDSSDNELMSCVDLGGRRKVKKRAESGCGNYAKTQAA